MVATSATIALGKAGRFDRPEFDFGLPLNATPVKTRLGAGLPTPPHYGPQVSNRRRKPMRWETFGQTGVRGQETRAQLARFASLNGIAVKRRMTVGL